MIAQGREGTIMDRVMQSIIVMQNAFSQRLHIWKAYSS